MQQVVPVDVAEEGMRLDLLSIGRARTQAPRWIAREQTLQQRHRVARHLDRIQRLVLKDRVKDLVLVVAAERRLAQEHLVQQNAKRPPVNCTTVALLEQDLGRHKLGRTAERAGRGAVPHVLLA